MAQLLVERLVIATEFAVGTQPRPEPCARRTETGIDEDDVPVIRGPYGKIVTHRWTLCPCGHPCSAASRAVTAPAQTVRELLWRMLAAAVAPMRCVNSRSS